MKLKWLSRFTVLVTILATGLAVISNPAVASAKKKLTQEEITQILNKGMDAEIVSPDGITKEDAQARLLEMNKRVLQNLQDPQAVKRWGDYWDKNKAIAKDGGDIGTESYGGSCDPTNCGNTFPGGQNDGDIVIATYDCIWSSVDMCHAGLWDASTELIRSANNGDSTGITYDGDDTTEGTDWETVAYWADNMEDVYVLEVPGLTSEEISDVTATAQSFSGTEFDVGAAKSSNTVWYCSKVVYRAYLDAASKTLDFDLGNQVSPWDIYADWDVDVVVIYN